jgi:hypothetical protein
LLTTTREHRLATNPIAATAPVPLKYTNPSDRFGRGRNVETPNICLHFGPPGPYGSIIRVDSLEKVIEKLATTEKTTIAIAREVGGKIRVTSGSWDGEKVILKDEVLEVRNVDGRL